jgi:ATP-dependent DNA helicase RecG
MMKEISYLLKEGEGLFIEFKEQYTDKIDRDIAAFSNTRGGKILLGVTDGGKIKGQELSNSLKAKIVDLASNCSPSIEIKAYKAGDVVVIDIPEGQAKPYACSGRFFKRYDAMTKQLNAEEVRTLFEENAKVSFEERLIKEFKLSDISMEKVKRFIGQCRLDIEITRKSLPNFLTTLNLLRGNHFKAACVLFFAKIPAVFLCSPGLIAYVSVGRKGLIYLTARKLMTTL